MWLHPEATLTAVDLEVCERCGLTWVVGTNVRRGRCPACWRFSAYISGQVKIAGRAIEVASLLAGQPILMSETYRGLDRLVLGDRCEHGWMTGLLCPTCCNAQ